MNTLNIILSTIKEKNISQKELCEHLNIKKHAFSDWKSGRTTSYKKYLPEIAEYLDVSINYLLGKESEEAPKVEKTVLRVPVLGNVAAGIPLTAIEDIEDYEELDADKYPQGDYIALKIHGSSMEPRMKKGDIVIVRRQDYADTGDTVIVMIGREEATCKKIKKTPEGVVLISTNSQFEPIFYSNKEIEELPVLIWGKVIELRAKF